MACQRTHPKNPALKSYPCPPSSSPLSSVKTPLLRPSVLFNGELGCADAARECSLALDWMDYSTWGSPSGGPVAVHTNRWCGGMVKARRPIPTAGEGCGRSVALSLSEGVPFLSCTPSRAASVGQGDQHRAAKGAGQAWSPPSTPARAPPYPAAPPPAHAAPHEEATALEIPACSGPMHSPPHRRCGTPLPSLVLPPTAPPPLPLAPPPLLAGTNSTTWGGPRRHPRHGPP